MTLAGTLLKRSSIEDPTVPLTSPALTDWLTGGSKSSSGVIVSEDRAYGLTAYLRAIALLSGTMGSLPLKLYKNSTRERVTQRTVLDSPNGAQTPFEFWQTMYANALGWGNGYAKKTRNGAGAVAQLWPIHPSTVRLEGVDPTDANPAGKLFHIRLKSGQIKDFTPDDILHLPYLAPDGKTGLSPLKAARESLGTAIAAEQYAGTFYKNGAHLDVALSTDKALKEEQANRLQESWERKHAGLDQAHRVAVLDSGVKIQTFGVNPEDAQLLESRKFGVVEIARMFGIPPHMLGDVEKSTSWGTGIEQQTIGFVVYTLRPWLTMVEQRVTREVLPGGWTAGMWFAEYALEGLLRGDSVQRATWYQMAIQSGWMNRNEVRALENREAADGLDEFIVPSNMAIIAVNGQATPVAAPADDVVTGD